VLICLKTASDVGGARKLNSFGGEK
jgi:hypothetical protein